MDLQRSILAGAIAAIGVLVFGFGALNVLNLVVVRSPTLRGLYSYLSSSLGDAIFLPAAAFFLVFAVCATRPTRTRWVVGNLSAVLGIAGGAAVQGAWLGDPSPKLNWTLIAPGEFNVAGWYHAVFLCATSGLFCGTTAFLIVAALAQDISQRALLASVLAISMLLVFAVLLAIDNGASGNLASVSSLVGIGIVLIAMTVAVVLIVVRALQRSRRSRM